MVVVGLLCLIVGDYFIYDEELKPKEMYAIFKHLFGQIGREDGKFLPVKWTLDG